MRTCEHSIASQFSASLELLGNVPSLNLLKGSLIIIVDYWFARGEHASEQILFLHSVDSLLESLFILNH
jgi:hypothetical protein